MRNSFIKHHKSCSLNTQQITMISSYNGYKLNSRLTCFQRSFIAQSIEHHTGIVEVIVRILLESLLKFFFLDFFATDFVALLLLVSNN